MSSLATNAITDAAGGNTATINSYTPTESNMAGRNRLINSDMRIDQRNAGAAVTASGAFPVDRWSVTNTASGAFSAQQDSSAPAGFNNSLLVTVTTAQTAGTGNLSPLQYIEGFNIADLGWGTATAQTVTLSFWVRSSLTGTFGGILRNNGGSRTYPYTYTISAPNTWEYKTVTIEGDTSGTWLTTNGRGVEVRFSLFATTGTQQTAGAWFAGSATGATGQTQLGSTNGATWQVTGVQLEAGSVATPFERRQYGQELALCQRYFVGNYKYFFTSGYDPSYTSENSGGVMWAYQMRTTPSIIISAGGMKGHHSTAPSAYSIDRNGVALQFTGAALRTNANTTANVSFTLSAEL